MIIFLFQPPAPLPILAKPQTSVPSVNSNQNDMSDSSLSDPYTNNPKTGFKSTAAEGTKNSKVTLDTAAASKPPHQQPPTAASAANKPSNNKKRGILINKNNNNNSKWRPPAVPTENVRESHQIWREENLLRWQSRDISPLPTSPRNRSFSAERQKDYVNRCNGQRQRHHHHRRENNGCNGDKNGGYRCRQQHRRGEEENHEGDGEEEDGEDIIPPRSIKVWSYFHNQAKMFK